MKPPKLPSLFKSQYVKKFKLIHRYYNPKKNNNIRSVNFKRINSKENQYKKRIARIIFLIIALSLFSYKFLIN